MCFSIARHIAMKTEIEHLDNLAETLRKKQAEKTSTAATNAALTHVEQASILLKKQAAADEADAKAKAEAEKANAAAEKKAAPKAE